MQEFKQAVLLKLNIKTNNSLLVDEIEGYLKAIYSEDYQSFISMLSDKKNYYNNFEKIKATHDHFINKYKAKHYEPLEQQAKDCEIKISRLERMIYIKYPKEVFEKIKDTNINTLNNIHGKLYFNTKERFILNQIGNFKMILDLVNRGYGAFTSNFIQLSKKAINDKYFNNKSNVTQNYALTHERGEMVRLNNVMSDLQVLKKDKK